MKNFSTVVGEMCLNENFKNKIKTLVGGATSNDPIPQQLEDFLRSNSYRLDRYGYGEIVRLMNNVSFKKNAATICTNAANVEGFTLELSDEFKSMIGACCMDRKLRKGFKDNGNTNIFNLHPLEIGVMEHILNDADIFKAMDEIDAKAWTHPNGDLKSVCPTAMTHSDDYRHIKHHVNAFTTAELLQVVKERAERLEPLPHDQQIVFIALEKKFKAASDLAGQQV